MADAETLQHLLKADVGDGLLVGPRRFPISAVGQSSAGDGLATREFSLGDDEYYLVIEGHLASGDPARVRAVLTHELAPAEARCQDRVGRPQLVAALLRASDDAPPTAGYHGRPYKFARRTDAQYEGLGRSCTRITWDYQAGSRNLAIERWPGGEMAVYEGEILPLGSIRVLPDYQPPRAAYQPAWGGQGPARPAMRVASPTGIVVGIIMMVIGFLLVVVD